MYADFLKSFGININTQLKFIFPVHFAKLHKQL